MPPSVKLPKVKVHEDPSAQIIRDLRAKIAAMTHTQNLLLALEHDYDRRDITTGSYVNSTRAILKKIKRDDP